MSLNTPCRLRRKPAATSAGLLCIALFLPLLVLSAAAQGPGGVTMTPHRDLGLKPVTLNVPAKFRGKFDSTHVVYLPDGFSAQIFWVGGLNKPRFLTWGPDSVLYVANLGSGVMTAMPDRNHDGVADTAYAAATNVFGHDVKFFNGAMYVATEHQVLKLTDQDGDGVYETRSVFIDSVGMHGEHRTGGHTTRTIVFDSLHGKLYLSVGSSCNVCRETNRAEIEEYNLDGTGRRVYATGVRNAVGMTLHPRTGRLWADNNGSDNQGNDIPAEWVDLVREHGFYGWPIAYGDGEYFNFSLADYPPLLPITSTDSANVRSMVQPAALIQAHSAPMALEFSNASFPSDFSRGVFVALHGSWNRTPATGVKVIYLDFSGDADTTADYAADFMTGFMTDSSTTARWARPVGLETDSRGRLYVGSDETGQFVAVVFSTPVSAVPAEHHEGSTGLSNARPNPSSGGTTISYDLPARGYARLTVVDVLGNTVATLLDGVVEAGPGSAYFNAAGLPDGVYFYRLDRDGTSETRPLVLIK